MVKIAKAKPKLDAIDLRILAAVAEQGRQTLTELSKAVNLSASPCTARLEKLETDRVILGYHADVDVEQLTHLSLYYASISVEPHSAQTALKIEELLKASPYVVTADALFGKRDYLVRIYARSTQHYYEIMAPFAALADTETWPISFNIVRPQTDRLVKELKRHQEDRL